MGPSNSRGVDDHPYLARQLFLFLPGKPTKWVPELVDYVMGIVILRPKTLM
jgi:hypothetical protein